WWYPPKQRSLKITLFDRVKDQVHSLEIGSIYYLQNVRFKVTNGRGQARCGQRGNDLNLIRKLSENHPDVLNLKRRKREFCHVDIPKPQKEPVSAPQLAIRSITTNKAPEMGAKLPQTTKEADSMDNVAVDPPSLKTQDAMSYTMDYVSVPITTEEYPPFPIVYGDIEPADTIECAKPNRHELMSLEEIKTCGIVPALFRFRGRIVKVTPSDLTKATKPF
ncbi:6386_t:CDS:2, partial [Acaulospora colombiana]